MTGAGKRIFDFTLSALAIVPGVFICAVSAVIIRLDSPGPAVFAQRRYGRDGELFTLYKLRTMTVDTEDLPSHDVGVAQVTRVGSVLRRVKFDEIPQLLNVLRGDMSLVGPRPCLPNQTDLIEERASRGLDSMRPGITGPSQVAGIDMSTPGLLAEIDASYLVPWSPGRDMSILVSTVLGRGAGDAARTGDTDEEAR